MKEMSNRDKLIIIIITIIAVLVAGFFALIRPKYRALVSDTATLQATQTEWDGIEAKLKAIPDLKNTITEIYNESSKTAKIFVNSAFADVDKAYSDEKVNASIDEHIQSAIDASQLKVNAMDISGVGTAELNYMVYEPNVVTYSLLEYADVNGNYADEVTEKLKTSTVLKETKVASVLGNIVNLTAVGKKADLMAFLDAIKSDKNAVLVTNVSIDDYTFKGGLEEEEEGQTQVLTPVEPVEQQLDEEGNPVETPTEAPTEAPRSNGEDEENLEGTSKISLEVIFYNAKPIDNPDLGD
jgi:hypothetical protein